MRLIFNLKTGLLAGAFAIVGLSSTPAEAACRWVYDSQIFRVSESTTETCYRLTSSASECKSKAEREAKRDSRRACTRYSDTDVISTRISSSSVSTGLFKHRAQATAVTTCKQTEKWWICN